MNGFRTMGVLALTAALAGAGTAEAQRRTLPGHPVRQSAANARGTTTVILVRHAEKETGNPLNQNPPLTARGRERAQALAQLLRGRHVDAILTTDLDRTRQTAAPLAQALGIRPGETHMGHDSDAAARLAVDSIRAHPGQTVLVVGHTTTVPRIIALLGGQRMGDICESAYSNVFTVTLRPNRAAEVTQAHYGAPDPDGGHECVNGIHVEHHGH